MAGLDLLRQYVKNYGLTKPDAFTPYAAGRKIYGSGRTNPSSGPVDKSGYLDRDLLNKARRNAVLARMKAEQSKNYLSANYLSGAK